MKDKLLYIKEAKIEELLSGSSSFGNNIDLIIEVYTWLFDSACGSCPSKFMGYINRIKTYQMDTKCNYKLKGNFQVTVSALGGRTMTNHNITNKSKMKNMLLKLKEINNNQLRTGGMIFAVIGFILIWYIKN